MTTYASTVPDPSAPSPLLGLPRRFLERRMQGASRLRNGLVALSVMAAGYALALLVLGLGGAQPGPEPWLTIPEETYFLWESAFIAPVIVCAGIMAAGVMHLLARAAGGKGSFEDTMALLGFATAVATLPTLVPDLVVGLLLCAQVVDEGAWMEAISHPTPVLAGVWVYLLLYLAAFLALYPAVVRVAHGLRGGRAIAIGWSSFALYQLFLYVFIR